MKISQARPRSRRLIIIGGLVGVGIIGFFVLWPCTRRELGSRAALGRDISLWRQVDSAVRVYQTDRGHYPASLDEPDFQSFLSKPAIAFLHEGRLAYHPPAPDSPPAFILLHLTTPRGDFSSQLDGVPVYPTSK